MRRSGVCQVRENAAGADDPVIRGERSKAGASALPASTSAPYPLPISFFRAATAFSSVSPPLRVGNRVERGDHIRISLDRELRVPAGAVQARLAFRLLCRPLPTREGGTLRDLADRLRRRRR
jgi:hypothetical protein